MLNRNCFRNGPMVCDCSSLSVLNNVPFFVLRYVYLDCVLCLISVSTHKRNFLKNYKLVHTCCSHIIVAGFIEKV